MLAINRSKEIWGEDAKTFRPERWDAIPEAAHGIPGVWGNTLSFLGGPRACIGYRFSVIECVICLLPLLSSLTCIFWGRCRMKALLYTLMRAFEFELAVPAADIRSKQTIVSRPIVLSEPEAGNQMPLLIRPYRA